MAPEKSDLERPSVRPGMCERSPLGLPHTQNRMSGRPRVVEILLMSSPKTLRVCGPENKSEVCGLAGTVDKFSTVRNKKLRMRTWGSPEQRRSAGERGGGWRLRLVAVADSGAADRSVGSDSARAAVPGSLAGH